MENSELITQLESYLTEEEPNVWEAEVNWTREEVRSVAIELGKEGFKVMYCRSEDSDFRFHISLWV